MPINGQIIPSLTQSHVKTYINDNTIFRQPKVEIEDGIRTICVFTSDCGRDNKILLKTSLSAYLEEYGNVNFKLHGQPALMPYSFLNGGYANVYCLRIMPDNATHAASILAAEVEVDEDGKAISINHRLVETMVSKPDELIAKMNQLLAEAETTNVYPLLAFYSQGRGVYGNSLRARLGSDLVSDKQNSYKNFSVEVMKSQNGLSLLETFARLSLHEDMIVNNNSMFIEDIINDVESGSNNVGIRFCVDGFEELRELHNSFCEPLSAELFDPLFGKDKANKAIPSIKIIRNEVEAVNGNTFVNLSDIEGIQLFNGNDGDFAADAVKRQEKIDAMLVKAFEGRVDKSIKSKRRTPADIIMDAGYSAEVKNALISLINTREDAYGIIDGGLLSNDSELLTWAEEISARAGRLFGKEGQHYVVRDPFTGKKVKVTTTYYAASKIPTHFKNIGRHVPFTGEEYARLTGHIKNTLVPAIDADDTDLKEKLTELRVNYYEAIGENNFVRGSQNTSQQEWSDLSEENNIHTLLQMKREIEQMVASLAYDFAEADDRKLFTESADRLLSRYRGMCRSAEVRFDATPFEEERSIIHAYLEVIFKSMVKSGIIEIDINPRV